MANSVSITAIKHLLPLSFRIDFKILLLVFKALNGQAPAYICDLLTPYEPDCLITSMELQVPVSV